MYEHLVSTQPDPKNTTSEGKTFPVTVGDHSLDGANRSRVIHTCDQKAIILPKTAIFHWELT